MILRLHPETLAQLLTTKTDSLLTEWLDKQGYSRVQLIGDPSIAKGLILLPNLDEDDND